MLILQDPLYLFFRCGQELSLRCGLWASSDEGALLLAVSFRFEQCALA